MVSTRPPRICNTLIDSQKTSTCFGVPSIVVIAPPSSLIRNMIGELPTLKPEFCGFTPPSGPYLLKSKPIKAWHPENPFRTAVGAITASAASVPPI